MMNHTEKEPGIFWLRSNNVNSWKRMNTAHFASSKSFSWEFHLEGRKGKIKKWNVTCFRSTNGHKIVCLIVNCSQQLKKARGNSSFSATHCASDEKCCKIRKNASLWNNCAHRRTAACSQLNYKKYKQRQQRNNSTSKILVRYVHLNCNFSGVYRNTKINSYKVLKQLKLTNIISA